MLFRLTFSYLRRHLSVSKTGPSRGTTYFMKVTWLSCLKKATYFGKKLITHMWPCFSCHYFPVYTEKKEKLLDIGKGFMKYKLQLSKCS